MPDATFTAPDLTTFTRLDALGLFATGQHLEPDRAVLECRVEPRAEDAFCRRCGAEGRPRGTVARRLAHEPMGWRPTTLLVRARRFGCNPCGHVWTQDTSRAAEPRAKLSRSAVHWALVALVVQHLSIARIAEGLGVAWNTVNDAVLAAGFQLLINDPTRFEGVKVLGVDEHVWRHARGGDKYVTVIIDLTPVRERTGPARLLDMVEGRSKQAFKTWLAARPATWQQQIEAVAMDGFTGFKSATVEELPDAAAVMDPFHVVRLAGDALDNCRRRVQQDIFGRRGMQGDPLYRARRTLLTGASLLTERQKARLEALFADERHLEVEATWGVYQDVICAYREQERGLAKFFLQHTIDRLAQGVPAGLPELGRLSRTLKQRAGDILSYFERPGTSNGPTEAINGRLEHLRGTALGFRNLTNYIARSLLESGGFRPRLHPQL